MGKAKKAKAKESKKAKEVEKVAEICIRITEDGKEVLEYKTAVELHGDLKAFEASVFEVGRGLSGQQEDAKNARSHIRDIIDRLFVMTTID